MSKRKWLIVLLYAMLCSQGLYAQSTSKRVMGISELFRLADENSKSIRAYRTGKESALAAVEVAKAQRLPDIDVSLSVSYIGNGYIWNRHFGDGMSVSLPHNGNNFSLAASQAIYTGGAISSGIALAELGQQMAELDIQKNQQEIRFLLVGHYLELYKLSNQTTILEQNITLTQQLVKNMHSRAAQGTALKNDITRYELQLETLKLQLNRVQDARKILNHQLVTTIGLPQQTEIVADSTLLTTDPIVLAETDWQQQASASNVGLQQAALAVKLNEQKIRLEQSELLPKVAIVAENHLDGPILVEVPVINSNFNYWFVGMGVKYNLASLFKNNKKVKKAQLDYRQSQELHALTQEHIENAVQACYTDYLTAFTDLHTQEKSVELANQNYSVTTNRYENDLALLTDMLDASNMKLGAELGLANARINVVYCYYKMKYTSGSL